MHPLLETQKDSITVICEEADIESGEVFKVLEKELEFVKADCVLYKPKLLYVHISYQEWWHITSNSTEYGVDTAISIKDKYYDFSSLVKIEDNMAILFSSEEYGTAILVKLYI